MPLWAEELPWSWKLCGQILGSIAASVALSMGILTCFAGHALCIVAGVWLIIAAVYLFVLEVPSCCGLCGGKSTIAGNLILKAVSYILIAIGPMATCASLGTIAACILILVTGTFYAISICFGRENNSSPRSPRK